MTLQQQVTLQQIQLQQLQMQQQLLQLQQIPRLGMQQVAAQQQAISSVLQAFPLMPQQQQQQQPQQATTAQQPAALQTGRMVRQPELYTAALARTQAIMAQNWQPNTIKQRDSVWAEFDSWSLEQLGRSGRQCTPLDVAVYLESSYLQKHGRQTAADGSSCPAPSSVQTTVAHLSTRFQELGCRGVWDWGTCTGNPCNSMEVKTFKGGYANQLQAQGFTPTSAKPISEAKLQQLVQQLAQEAALAQQQSSQPWHVATLLWRDACIAQYLWDSMRRPAEASGLQTDAVQVSVSASSGSSVQAQPHVSKMCHASRGSRQPRPVTLQGAVGEHLGQLLLQYVHCLQLSGRSLGQFMFSPLQPSKQGLQTDQGLSTSAMSQRVIGHLKRLGLHEGETLYSIKRGAMQHAYFIGGLSLQAIGEAADIETEAVVQVYLDPTRHL